MLTFSIIENIIREGFSIIEIAGPEGSDEMARMKFQTLTEQMFYALLCLRQECCGMDILDQVPVMTDGRVSVGSGTLYTLLEQFLEADMIRETRVEGRRRSYILTKKGRDMLEKEYRRIRAQAADYRKIFGDGSPGDVRAGEDREVQG